MYDNVINYKKWIKETVFKTEMNIFRVYLEGIFLIQKKIVDN